MSTFSSIKTWCLFNLLGSPLLENVDLRGDAGAQGVYREGDFCLYLHWPETSPAGAAQSFHRGSCANMTDIVTST